MGTRKQKLSFTDHKQVAAELSELRNRMQKAFIKLGEAYPNGSKQVRLAHKASQAVDDLRNEMDDILSRDFPDQFEGNVYYPANKIARQRG